MADLVAEIDCLLCGFRFPGGVPAEGRSSEATLDDWVLTCRALSNVSDPAQCPNVRVDPASRRVDGGCRRQEPPSVLLLLESSDPAPSSKACSRRPGKHGREAPGADAAVALVETGS